MTDFERQKRENNHYLGRLYQTKVFQTVRQNSSNAPTKLLLPLGNKTFKEINSTHKYASHHCLKHVVRRWWCIMQNAWDGKRYYQTCDYSVQYTGLKTSIKRTETRTLLHNFNSNLTEYPLGPSTNKYNIFNLISTSRSWSIIVFTGDMLCKNKPKQPSSWWIS